MVFSATLPTIDALTAGVSSPPSFSYSAARDTSHSFSESTRVPSMSHSTAFTPAIVSWGRRSVKIMTILVTGATGNIGRRIVDHLIDLGANDIRALTTNPAKAKLPDGVTPVTGYLGKPESLPAALNGVDRMYLAPLPETLDVTLEMAKAANVSYVVALSGGAHWQRHADTISASGAGQHPTRARRVPGELRHLVGADQGNPHGAGAVSISRGGADRDGRHRQGRRGAVGQA